MIRGGEKKPHNILAIFDNPEFFRISPSMPYPSPRVSQLDAYILDNELFSLLKLQLSDVFSLHSTKSWSYSQNPELWLLALNLVVFKLTTLKTGSSYGLKLQNLKLSNSKTGKLIGKNARIILLAIIIADYILKRFQLFLYSVEDGGRAAGRSLIGRFKDFVLKHRSVLLNRTSEIVKVANLANFVLFIVQGQFPTLVHRILGISLTPVVADLLKFNGNNVNFEFQNRQLVWNVMTEFLVFTLPLLHLRKWSRMVRNWLPSRKSEEAEVFISEKPLTTQFTSLPLSQCAICIGLTEISGIKAASTYVTNPCITNCGHIFCYVCLATRFNAIENGSEEAEGCPRCRIKLTSFQLYAGDVADVDKDAIMVEYEDAPEPGETEVTEKLGNSPNQEGHSEDVPDEDTSEEGSSSDSDAYLSDELAYEEDADGIDLEMDEEYDEML